MRLIKLALATSLFLNLTGGSYFAYRKLHPRQSAPMRWQGTPPYKARVDTVAAAKKFPVIFLGDSITEAGQWGEATNCGLGGDTIADVRARLDGALNGRPATIFLMIGINNLLQGHSPGVIVSEYRLLVSEIVSRSPTSRLIVQSVLPVRPSLMSSPMALNGKIREVNSRLSTLPNITFLDLHSRFADTNGELQSGLTYDGIHLTAGGYQLWRELLAPVMETVSQ